MPFNWFDIAILLFLGLGIQRGRKHGMSQEMILVFKWLAIIIVGGLGYAVIGDVISDNSVFSRLSAYLMAYIIITLGITVAFWGIKKMAGGKLIGSDVFGSGEYYLGMVAGLIRYACILIFALSFLNARLYSDKEIADDLKFQNDVYGSNYFPKLYTVQDDVFKKSFVGPHIHDALGFLLIKGTYPETKELRKEREVGQLN
ncbi:MAG TPA: CvpA family protein [Verrucomicrobiae bacterium]|nr:CvpA family protein [Verrucomicrobiae bacterium]